ncbi:MAG: DsbE family thiol:disulfide interchange protein [Leptothrix sp. (in: Bacteria)]|nr:DsbE family thiol:disulfide interchange protein [Leptothrix sp. (in: b-proteobacteria)]
MSKRFLWPLGIFLILLAFLGVGLRRDPQEIPSPFIGKAAPTFTLTQLESPQKSFSPRDMQGQVWLLNVWASWCASCREEHPVLLAFSKQAGVPIVGLNYKDARNEGQQWLSRFGNPYQVSAFDSDGRVGIDYGVYGVPETFVIDKHGVVRLKHTGPITEEVIRSKLLPLIKELSHA